MLTLLDCTHVSPSSSRQACHADHSVVQAEVAPDPPSICEAWSELLVALYEHSSLSSCDTRRPLHAPWRHLSRRRALSDFFVRSPKPDDGAHVQPRVEGAGLGH